MKKRLYIWFGLTLLLMVGYPWLTVYCAPAESMMALCILLFYLFAPLFSIAAGAAAGKQIHTLWSLVLLPSLFFVIGTWLCFEMGETDFLLYAAVYLLLSTVSALMSLLYHRQQNR